MKTTQNKNETTKIFKIKHKNEIYIYSGVLLACDGERSSVFDSVKPRAETPIYRRVRFSH